MSRRTRRNRWGWTLGLCLGAVGCASPAGEPVDAPRDLAPLDSGAVGAGADPAAAPSLIDVMRAEDERELERKAAPAAPTDAGKTPEPRSAAPGSAPAPGNVPPTPAPAPSYAVAAMVGQVNGNAIYASAVFEPLEEQLAALGRQLSRSAFRDRASQLIAARLGQLVTDALILGEAERDLSEHERRILTQVLQNQREELIRRHGRGSPAVAEATLLRETGKSLAQTLEEFRQRVVVERYQKQKVLPMINVTRREVERYYREHADQYNPPATRTLRLIRAASEADAQTLAQRLKAGEPFAEVAASKLNRFRPGDAGLMGATPGDKVFGDPARDEAMARLKAGQYAGPIAAQDAYWFIFVEQLDRPAGKSLKEAQAEIEQILWQQQFRVLSSQYQRRIYEEGSYHPIAQMGESLVEIAMSRYAAAE